MRSTEKIVNEKITALVVTHNRKNLLKKCLNAILSQTYSVDQILIIDNASTDGTKDMLKKEGYLGNDKIFYCLMDHNLGGSGGFYEGIKRSMCDKNGWIWVMDDDTVPSNNCLEELIKAIQIIKGKRRGKKISCLASTIYGPNGEFINVPAVDDRPTVNGDPNWYEFLNHGIVKLRNATFVSLLINKDAVKRCGYPCKDYFIWGDDTEYTRRLTTYYGNAYFVGSSIAVHNRKGVINLSLAKETDPNRIQLYYYYYRNTLINIHYYDGNYRGAITEFIKTVLEALKYIHCKPYALEKVWIVVKGRTAAITQYKKFKAYIDKELHAV